jgi:hypothetical protein
MSNSATGAGVHRPVHQLARIVLVWFLFTFIAARVLVLLIMLRKLPDLYLHVSQTHIHHLNYGIFLLSGIGAFLLFNRPSGRQLVWCAAIYGIAMGLTFDEFGMWVHLGGSYWQRASFDAVVVVAAVFGLIAEAPRIRRFQSRHWLTAVGLLVAVVFFALLLARSLAGATRHLGPTLRQLEQSGPQ